MQIFHLSILPGTAFRQEAVDLGLRFQPRPPYYVLRTPLLGREDLYGLMQEAQELFGLEFDAQPPPVLDFEPAGSVSQVWRVDLNGTPGRPSSLPDRWAQAFTIWLKSSDFQASRDAAVACIRHVLQTNPFTTLHVVLDMSPARGPQHCTDALRPETLQTFTASCLETTSYLDRYYAMQPGRPNGAKRLIVVLPALAHGMLDEHWLEDIGAIATVVWHRPKQGPLTEIDMEPHEYAWTS